MHDADLLAEHSIMKDVLRELLDALDHGTEEDLLIAEGRARRVWNDVSGIRFPAPPPC